MRKVEGTGAHERERFQDAVELFSEALHLNPRSTWEAAEIFVGRAASYIEVGTGEQK